MSWKDVAVLCIVALLVVTVYFGHKAGYEQGRADLLFETTKMLNQSQQFLREGQSWAAAIACLRNMAYRHNNKVIGDWLELHYLTAIKEAPYLYGVRAPENWLNLAEFRLNWLPNHPSDANDNCR